MKAWAPVRSLTQLVTLYVGVEPDAEVNFIAVQPGWSMHGAAMGEGAVVGTPRTLFV